MIVFTATQDIAQMYLVISFKMLSTVSSDRVAGLKGKTPMCAINIPNLSRIRLQTRML